ncbi:MAG TPA: ribonuclease Z [Cyclobacteriaceae bacterium]
MTFHLTILGSNSAIPAHGRNHTSQILVINNEHFLIDCGEGTQLQIARYKCKLSRINHILISHLHGDHYLGLIGLISSMHLQGRKKTLNLWGPAGLREIVSVQLKFSQTILNFPIYFSELDEESGVIYQNNFMTITSFRLNHRIPCFGFLFKEKKKPRRLKKEKLPAWLQAKEFRQLKNGKDLTDPDGKIIKNTTLTDPPRKSRSYAYCSDTRYMPELTSVIANCDILYHEATFLHENMEWAESTFHSTTVEAATLAKNAKAGKLLIGHFSARYKDLSPFLEEARPVFESTELAIEGRTYSVDE